MRRDKRITRATARIAGNALLSIGLAMAVLGSITNYAHPIG